MRTSMSCGSRSNAFATVLAITLRVPVPISWTAQLATMRPPRDADVRVFVGRPFREPRVANDEIRCVPSVARFAAGVRRFYDRPPFLDLSPVEGAQCLRRLPVTREYLLPEIG